MNLHHQLSRGWPPHLKDGTPSLCYIMGRRGYIYIYNITTFCFFRLLLCTLSSHPFYSPFQFFLIVFNHIFWFVILISCFFFHFYCMFLSYFLYLNMGLQIGIFSFFSSTQRYDFLFSLPFIAMAQNLEHTQFFVRPFTV